MDWFASLNLDPVVSGLSAIVVALLGTIGVVWAAWLKHGKADPPGDLAAMSFDTSQLKMVAAAIEGMNLTLIESNQISREARKELEGLLERLLAELNELRDELRRQGEGLRK